jgi:hypothetical protein
MGFKIGFTQSQQSGSFTILVTAPCSLRSRLIFLYRKAIRRENESVSKVNFLSFSPGADT